MQFFKVQKSWTEIEFVLNQSCPKALSLWWCLSGISNIYGISVVSQRTLMKLLGVKSRTTINNALRCLRKMHLLLIEKIGSQNVYIQNPRYISQTSKKMTEKYLAGNNIVFKGLVISKKENQKYFNDFKNFVKYHKTRQVKLSRLHTPRNNGGVADKNGQPIRHHNHYNKKTTSNPHRHRNQK